MGDLIVKIGVLSEMLFVFLIIVLVILTLVLVIKKLTKK
ncbi:hypothetical protein IGJ84_000564 [Enterococcus sp. DIV0181]